MRLLLASLFIAFALSAGSALATDGVIEINAASVAAGGITPSDTPGYPVTLDQPGSYRLTSNLVQSVVIGTFVGTSAIEVSADDVSIDLNGFTIECRALNLGGASSRCASGSAYGIEGLLVGGGGQRTTVRNGTVGGFPQGGVLLGDFSQIDSMNVSENATGIRVGKASTVSNSRAAANISDGIVADSTGGTISSCTSVENGRFGFFLAAGWLLQGSSPQANGEARRCRRRGLAHPGQRCERQRHQWDVSQHNNRLSRERRENNSFDAFTIGANVGTNGRFAGDTLSAGGGPGPIGLNAVGATGAVAITGNVFSGFSTNLQGTVVQIGINLYDGSTVP